MKQFIGYSNKECVGPLLEKIELNKWVIFYLCLYYQSRKSRSGVTFTYNVEKVAEDITDTWMKSYQK